MARILVIGDLHGDFKPVRELYDRNQELFDDSKEKTILICLGDFGANYFFDYRDDNYKAKLGKYPFEYFVIRGNHEQRPSFCADRNPDSWHIEKYFDGSVYVENKYPHIKYADDVAAIYNIEGYKTLILPGAYSVDKFRRLAFGWSWFEEEQLSSSEMWDAEELVLLNGCHFDLILSHTCPQIYEPTDLFLSVVDQSTIDKSMELFFNKIEKITDYRVWCWGHYHADREYPQLEDGSMRYMFFNEHAYRLEDLFDGKLNEY